MRANNMDHEHAIVVGGSMAGLLTACVLSDRYQRISLVERDTLPTQPQHRRGVPQSRRTHGLLASGSNVLEKFFPGISDSLVDAGGLTCDFVRDCRWFFEGACLAVEFARSLPAPYIHEVVSRAEPLGDAASTRFPASTRQRYEALKRFPSGYLVFGDAICSFNPIYGQGMSVAALQAEELEKSLAASGDDLAKVFFRRAAKVVDIPWSMAVGSDLRIPETVGPRTTGVRINQLVYVKAP